MSNYIKVSEDEGDEPIEIPCEEDDTILLTTLSSLFPGASGLKYRNSESGTLRGLRLIDGKLQAPDDGWTSIPVYYCCFPKDNKRKMEDQSDSDSNTKTKKIDDKRKTSDLIVLGLAWKTTDKELKEYFEQFGELVMAQVKKDPKSGLSKGFGFIRFVDSDNQSKVFSKRHYIDGRYCDVRIPMSKDGYGNERYQEFNKKIFIGRLTEDITIEDLRDYFTKYGEIADVFIPKPFRGFAFVTFRDIDIAQTILNEDHIIKGLSVHVSNAVPKVEMSSGGGGYAGGYSSKNYGRYSNYSPNSYHSHMSAPISSSGHHHPANYSPPASQYDYYSRHRSNQHSYHDSSNPYKYGSYNASDYPPYY